MFKHFFIDFNITRSVTRLVDKMGLEPTEGMTKEEKVVCAWLHSLCFQSSRVGFRILITAVLTGLPEIKCAKMLGVFAG